MSPRTKPSLAAVVLNVCLFFSCFASPALAQQGQAQVQQLVESGKITSQQAQQATEALEKGQINPEAVKQLQNEGKLGALTPAEIEAGKKILEQTQEGDQPQPPEPPRQEEPPQQTEEEFLKKISVGQRPALTIFGHELFSRPPSTFAPISAIPVSNNYIIGPGDEVKVLMWGRLQSSNPFESE